LQFNGLVKKYYPELYSEVKVWLLQISSIFA
jgi:hypothetical protein